ncbi:MAG: YraN family protein [Candidatus Nanopelagicales bacterium]|jgi:putative endonuclease
MTSTRQRLGRLGENLACRHLRDLGFLILDRNWRCRDGEIDVVALDSGQVVICEVRTRHGTTAGTPAESITRSKIRRLRKLAWQWLQHRGAKTSWVRIDVIGIQIDDLGRHEITHIRGVE